MPRLFFQCVVIAALVVFAGAASAQTKRLECKVVRVDVSQSNGNQDKEFVRKNMSKTYTLAIGEKSVQVDMRSPTFKNSSDRFVLISDQLLSIVAARGSPVGLETLVIAKSRHKTRGHTEATLTIQGSFFANIWHLGCD